MKLLPEVAAMIKNTNEQFGLISTYIHWVSAIMVFSLFALGFWMVDLNYYSEWYRDAPYYHKAFGLILLLVTVLRLIWKFYNTAPNKLGRNKFEQNVEKIAHIALYGILFLLMFSGYLISTADGRGIDLFNVITIPSMGELFPDQEDIAGDIHEITAYIIMAMVGLHIAAALQHHFIRKDDTLKRMSKFK